MLIYKRYGKNGIRYRNHTIAVTAVCTLYTENKDQCLYHEVCAHCPQKPVSLQQTMYSMYSIYSVYNADVTGFSTKTGVSPPSLVNGRVNI